MIYTEVREVQSLERPVPEGVIVRSDWGLHYICPCGCKREVYLSRRDKDPNRQPSWEFHKETITVSPSIRETTGCKAHYWIRNGKVEFCSDSGR